VGIDPHKQSHTAVAIDGATGQVRGERTVRARSGGYEQLVAWARDWTRIACSPSKTAATSPAAWSAT